MKDDKATEVLVATHKRIAQDIPLNLVKKCYEIEKEFLFDKDRNRPMETIRQVVEEYVANESK